MLKKMDRRQKGFVSVLVVTSCPLCEYSPNVSKPMLRPEPQLCAKQSITAKTRYFAVNPTAPMAQRHSPPSHHQSYLSCLLCSLPLSNHCQAGHKAVMLTLHAKPRLPPHELLVAENMD